MLVKVKLYSASWCTQCIPVKKEAATCPIEVAVIDIDSGVAIPPQVRGLPTLEVDGVFYGGAAASLKALKELKEWKPS